MAVHMVRLYLEPPKGNAENAVDNWVTNHNEWEEDPTEHSLREVESAGGTTYLSGNYRFHQDEHQTELLSDLTDRLDNIQGGLWYRIGYHVCSHDENSPAPCEWEDTREAGEVPVDVPSFE